jgi:hypothetical protein
MKTMRGFGDGMVWTEIGKRSYELRAGGDVVATLRWPKGFGSPAHGETAEGRVLLERSGLLRPQVLLRVDSPPSSNGADAAPPSQRPPLLTLGVDLGGRGVAVTPEGQRFDWKPSNLWRTTWVFEQSGRPLVSFDADSAVTFRHKVTIAAGVDAPDLAGLVLLGSAVGVYLTEDAAVFGI